MRPPTSRFRARKLGLKQNLSILREKDIDADDDLLADEQQQADLLERLPKVESGVEQREEKEHHLQAVISAANAASVGGKVNQVFIPTPDAKEAQEVQYDRLYPQTFSQPATYIRFSSTVEDSIGTPYCMSPEDADVLKSLNEKRAKGSDPCDEDQFEAVMNFFEETSQARQPFAAVDNTPVLSYEEMEAAFDDSVDETARKFAKEIYDWWKEQRLKMGNKSIMPKLKTLKMETGQEADDSDPYVCFRRREVRQVRKTRGRDAQVTEKLKKLRKELEEARALVDSVRRREYLRKEDLAASQELFEQRAKLRTVKRSLGLFDEPDDELLINQRTPKVRKVVEQPVSARPQSQMKLSRGLGEFTVPDTEMIHLRDKIQEREQIVATRIAEELAAFEAKGRSFIDRTEDAILGLYTPPDLEDRTPDFVSIAVKAEPQQQPTPPESIASEHSEEDGNGLEDTSDFNVRWAQPPEQASFENQLRYRKRVGRGGRLMIDRHNYRGGARDTLPSRLQERFKYDHDEGDFEEFLELPSLDTAASFRYRALLPTKDPNNANSILSFGHQRRISAGTTREAPAGAGGSRN